MDTVKQPSDNDLHAAWSDAISAEGIAGAHSEELQTLRDLRAARTTWFGGKANKLRGSIDRYLEYYHA